VRGSDEASTGRASLRTRTAVIAGRAVGRLSKVAGRGYGTVIGGVVAGLIDPRVLERLAATRDCVLVSGTNGKSTTSHMLAAALGTAGPVALNAAGSNMEAGLVMALATAPTARSAVLELDEAVLQAISRQTRPAAIVLTNLSREYTRGVLLRRIVADWRSALAAIDWPCVVVANADDPLTVAVATEAPMATWVSGGMPWTRDAEVCPRCLAPVRLEGRDWWCTACDLRRPAPDWTVTADATLRGPDGTVDLRLAVPGRWNLPNAAFAIAAASHLGVAPAAAAAAISRTVDVGGRYVPRSLKGHEVRLVLVKNPASWHEAVSLAEPGDRVVIALEPFGIKDMAPQWDVSMRPLAGSRVAVAGQRRLDMATLLEADGVPFELRATAEEAIAAMPPGPVTVICNYTAFLDLKHRLAH
jgi:UDP-N-acetylmuramyl tripeptide synthase